MSGAQLVVDGGDSFWYAFYAVAEGKLADGHVVPIAALPHSSMSVIGVQPTEDFLDCRGYVAEDAAKTLDGEGWECVGVSVGDATAVGIGPYGRLIVHAEAYFDYVGPDGNRERVTVSGNSQSGLTARPDHGGRTALDELLAR